MKAGASGILGGRAFWKEYFTIDKPDERQAWARKEAAGRVKETDEIVRSRGKPWFARYGLTLEEIGNLRAVEGWHIRYGGGSAVETKRGQVGAEDVY
jgi:tagatose 1,6-diphosphate aldolase